MTVEAPVLPIIAPVIGEVTKKDVVPSEPPKRAWVYLKGRHLRQGIFAVSPQLLRVVAAELDVSAQKLSRAFAAIVTCKSEEVAINLYFPEIAEAKCDKANQLLNEAVRAIRGESPVFFECERL